MQPDGDGQGFFGRSHLSLGFISDELIEDADGFNQGFIGTEGGIDEGQRFGICIHNEGEIAVCRLQVADGERGSGGGFGFG